MKRIVALSTAVLVTTACAVAMAGDKTCGLQIGDRAASAFNVKDITGPFKDSGPLCYR